MLLSLKRNVLSWPPSQGVSSKYPLGHLSNQALGLWAGGTMCFAFQASGSVEKTETRARCANCARDQNVAILRIRPCSGSKSRTFFSNTAHKIDAVASL